MTAPQLNKKKFWIIKPSAGRNYVKNPQPYISTGGYSVSGGTIAVDSTNARRGPGCIKCTPNSGVPAIVSYSGLTGTSGLAYSFSLDVLGVAGQAMRIYVQISGILQGTKTFTATGYWQRMSLSFISNRTGAVVLSLQQDITVTTAPFWTDGWQFEQAVKPSTFISGDLGEGYYWEGLPRDSASTRMNYVKTGGELLDLEDYCQLVQVTGLGHGDWNQILTKMTSGGDLYQGHIRKSRQFSIIVDFIGETLGEIEANRKALIDAIRPDLFEGEMVVRYQGFDDNGNEATNPIDIHCIPLPATLTDTPDMPNHQRDVLNFSIPSGLLQGAYNEGAELDFIADFAAEYIVRRDPDGKWYEETSPGVFANPVAGMTGEVMDIKEAPNGDIYVCGRFANVDGIGDGDGVVRWSKANQAWEAVGAPNVSGINVMAFTASGNLLVGGSSQNIAGVPAADYFAKYTVGTGSPAAWEAVGADIVSTAPSNKGVRAIAISPAGHIYIGGTFESASGNTNCKNIAWWNSTTGLWTPLSTGLNGTVNALAFAPNGDLYIGGEFTDAAYPYLCKWDGTAFSVVGTNTDIGFIVYALAFDHYGKLLVGGAFTNAGGIPNADYIARRNGFNWESLGYGTNGPVRAIFVKNIAGYQEGNRYYAPKGWAYVAGSFTRAGGLISLKDRVAIWHNGTWSPLDINLPGDPTSPNYAFVQAVLSASDGSLYVGGTFSTTDEGENATCGVLSDRVSTVGVVSASANTYPVINITGSGTLKSITNYSTGKSIMFDGLTLQAGETVSLNLDPLNIVFKSSWSGRGNLMRYVAEGSDYGDFYLKPGSNSLSIYMTDTTVNSGAWIAWTPQFWGLDGALL